ncbi:MAG: signal peptidase II [Deltaproteobacteria bacterium]|nr:signal peptidase II [Deltaproteobacteria bacterium]
MSPKSVLFLGSLSLGLALDQLSKWWIYTHLAYGSGEVEVIPRWFSLVHAQNPGAVFGSFGDSSFRVPLFLGFTVIAVGIIGRLWWQLPKDRYYLPMTYGLILSGALGNAIDRIHKRTVTDFLLVQGDVPGLRETLVDWFGTYRWPAFNVADMALVGGVGLYLLWELILERPAKDKG